MKLRELNIFEFDNFAMKHPLGSYHQTSTYALFATEQGYDYDLMGLVDDNNKIVAASLIISKKIGLFYKYGYAPKGFLLDYFNPKIVEEFTKALKKYYFRRNFAFIKINPEISIGDVNYEKQIIKYNKNKDIENILDYYNFSKINYNNKFNTKLPKYNAILLLKKADFKNYNKNTRNKINKSLKNGLSFEQGKLEHIKVLYEFVKNKKDEKIDYYYNYFNSFSKNKSIDIHLVKINFEECLISLKEKYEKELIKNNKLTDKTLDNPTQELLAKKLQSDKTLDTLKQNITKTTKYLSQKTEEYIAGAMTIKYKNRISILISGFDEKYKDLCPNYFLHYNIIEYFKKDYDFLDLNGISGDFTKENPYKGLDEFKLGFKPLCFEYINEYDFIINEGLYKNLIQSGLLEKEFKKKEKSIKN